MNGLPVLEADAQVARPPAGGTKSKRRALLIKFGAIGDVVMAIPAAAALHREGFSIDWVASSLVAPLLSSYPWIRVLEVAEESLLRGSIGARTRASLQLWQKLWRYESQSGRYDLIATLYYDPRYRLLSLPLRARRRVSLSWVDRKEELLPGRHHTDEYARILLGRRDEVNPFQLAPIPVPNLPESPLPACSGRPRVVLVPAGARNALRDDALRRWPIEAYVTLTGELLRVGCEVVLIGGPDDGWASPYFADLEIQPGGGTLVDCIGCYNLLESLALLNTAAVTITHDTGPLHLAGLTHTALISVFGPTDPHGRLPRKDNVVAFWGGEGFACRPCYDGRDYAPCRHNACMAQITPAMVLAEVLTFLDPSRRHRSLSPKVIEPISAGLVQIAVEEI